MSAPKFTQIISDPKQGLCALAEDGTVWRWVPETYSGGFTRSAKWEQVK